MHDVPRNGLWEKQEDWIIFTEVVKVIKVIRFMLKFFFYRACIT